MTPRRFRIRTGATRQRGTLLTACFLIDRANAAQLDDLALAPAPASSRTN